MVLGPILSIELEGIPLVKRGKVREIYDLGKYLLIISTDRISAFDVVMPNGIPRKGQILTAMSRFWFQKTSDIIENHLVSTDMSEIIRIMASSPNLKELLEDRSMLVKKAKPFPIECVVREYLAGAGWKEYLEKGSLAGVSLPEGLRQSEKLPEAVFSPSTKEESGHDISLTQKEASDLVGEETYRIISRTSLELCHEASEYAEKRGIIIADTKFEFGIYQNRIILIDEIITPDSSRLWPLEDYLPGRTQKSFDKQFVRDYLESTGWDKKPPAPVLPDNVVSKTTEKYLEALERLAGTSK